MTNLLEIMALLKNFSKHFWSEVKKNHFYHAYADDTAFFLKDKESVKKAMNVFDTFSIYSDLKPNKSKCKIACIGVLKGVSMGLYGMECIDLTKNLVKILGIHFPYNRKIENEQNFIKLIKKIENVLKIWKTRNLTVQVAKLKFLTLRQLQRLFTLL